eukprot:449573_1
MYWNKTIISGTDNNYNVEGIGGHSINNILLDELVSNVDGDWRIILLQFIMMHIDSNMKINENIMDINNHIKYKCIIVENKMDINNYIKMNHFDNQPYNINAIENWLKCNDTSPINGEDKYET